MDSQNYIKIFENKDEEVTLAIGRQIGNDCTDVEVKVISIPYENLDFIITSLNLYLEEYHEFHDYSDYTENQNPKNKAKVLTLIKDEVNNEN